MVVRARVEGGEVGGLRNRACTEDRVVLRLRTGRGWTPRAGVSEELWEGGAEDIDDNTLSVHVSRLRDKVGAAHIRTVRGVGYQWLD